jgi:alkylated DNA repair protein (DNA oxidative demethylase)
MIEDLFERERGVVPLAAGAMVLRGFAQPFGERLLAALGRVVARAPFRHMVTPGGHRMSVAMTNCGAVGWVTDRAGYRYDHRDPESGRRWPAMPDEFAALAVQAAARAGFDGFAPDACLVNRYEPGTRLSLHQDKNEQDFEAPIVSISLGLPAIFLFGGLERRDPARRVPLAHGDVAVWGGPARLTYHGVMPLDPGQHPVLGACRINLTFRKAG